MPRDAMRYGIFTASGSLPALLLRKFVPAADVQHARDTQHTHIHLKRSKIAKSTMDVSIEWQRLCFVSIEVTVVQPNGKRAQTWIQKNEADEENCMCRSSHKKRVARKQVTNTYYTVRNGVKYCEECDLAWGDVLVAFVCAEFASGCRITVICI